MKRGLSFILSLIMVIGIITSVPITVSAASESALTFSLNSDGNSYYVQDCITSASGEITIPNTYNGKPVTRLGGGAFEDCTYLTSITIPDSVTSIGEYAFSCCEILTSITIPDSVTTIGDSAFKKCSRLASVSIGNSVKTISDALFFECSNLSSITIPNSVTTIGNSAFFKCTNLWSFTIPNSVTSIGHTAFRECISLRSVTIPDSVTSIGYAAFYKCSNLRKIDVATNNPNYTSCCEVLFNKDKTTLIKYPEGMTNTIYTIPDSVTSIGDYAFVACKNLTNIKIPEGVTSIGRLAFLGCSSLTSITIPEGVTSIRDNTFTECYNLTSITIPDSVTSIGDYAFDDCKSLKYVFYLGNKSDWQNIYMDRDSPSYGLTNTAIHYNSTGHNYGDLIIIEPSCEKQGKEYYECSDCGYDVVVEVLPDLGGHKRSEWIVRYEPTCTEYGKKVIKCTVCNEIISSIEINAIGHNYIDNYCTNCDGCVFEYIIEDNYVTITGYLGTGTDVAIPSEIEGFPVTNIGDCAFEKCTSLTYVTIPDSVTSIGDYAFNGCSSLISITIPNSVTSIGNYAFCNCYNLTSITIPDSVTSIGSSAFAGCKKMTDVSFGFGINYIGSDAFDLDSSLENIYYSGTDSDWESVLIEEPNVYLHWAKIHFNVGIAKWENHYGEAAITMLPTCTSKGTQTYTCPCGHQYSESIVALGHEYSSEWTIDAVATCTENGSKSHHCTRCDSMTNVTVITAQGHSYGEWRVISEPTCSKEGSKTRTCSTCEYIEIVAIPTIAHNYSTEWIIDKEVTCTEKGSKSHHCTRCDSVVDITVINPLGHTSSDWIIDKNATCTENGSKHKECTVCGDTIKTETIPALGHTVSDWIIVTETSAEAPGEKHKECIVCGGVLETEEIPQLKPSTPKLTSATRISNGVKVTWGEVEGADSYIVYRKTSKSGWTNLGTTTENTFTDTKAKTGTTYYYTVKAQNEAGASGYNKTGLKIKYVAAPKLTKITNESSGVRVYWSKVSGADGYYLYRRVAGSKTWTKVATIKKGSTTSYLDKKASAGKTYEYIIKCYDGSTPSASAAKAIKIERLTVPKLVSAKSGKSGITFKWGKVTGAEGYLVYRKTGKGSWVQLTKVEGNAKVSYVDKSAKKGKTYTYTVKAYSGSYTSAYNTKGLKIKDKY